jgi:hypothetical protein
MCTDLGRNLTPWRDSNKPKPNPFVVKIYKLIHNFYRGKNRPKTRATSTIKKIIGLSKQSPNDPVRPTLVQQCLKEVQEKKNCEVVNTIQNFKISFHFVHNVKIENEWYKISKI